MMAAFSERPREALGDLLGNEIILPAQFWSRPVQDLRTEPERRLMLAVLENAVLTLHRCALKPSAQGRRIATEVRTWIASNSRRHPFAFAAICDVLGIDMDYLRGMIARWTDEGAPTAKPRRRHAGRGRHQVRLRRRKSR
jgi:hypothetical protein